MKSHRFQQGHRNGVVFTHTPALTRCTSHTQGMLTPLSAYPRVQLLCRQTKTLQLPHTDRNRRVMLASWNSAWAVKATKKLIECSDGCSVPVCCHSYADTGAIGSSIGLNYLLMYELCKHLLEDRTHCCPRQSRTWDTGRSIREK